MNDTLPPNAIAVTDARKAVALLSPIARRNPRTPTLVLGGDDGWPAYLSASDGHRSAALTIPGSVASRFAVYLAPLKALLGAVSGSVSVSAGETRATFDDGTTLATLDVTQGHDVIAGGLDPDGSLVAPCDAVSAWLARVAVSIAHVNRYGLNGCHIEIGDAVRAISTDGNRLTVTELEPPFTVTGGWATIPREGKTPVSPILAAADVRWLVAALKGRAGDVHLFWAGNRLHADFPGGHLRTRLIEADFPRWREVLPRVTGPVIDVDRDALVKAVRRVMWAARDTSTSLKVAVSAGVMQLAAKWLDNGAVSTECPIGLDGESRTFGLNARFLLDALGVLPAGPVTVTLDPQALGPIMLRSRVSSRTFALVMPVRLG